MIQFTGHIGQANAWHNYDFHENELVKIFDTFFMKL